MNGCPRQNPAYRPTHLSLCRRRRAPASLRYWAPSGAILTSYFKFPPHIFVCAGKPALPHLAFSNVSAFSRAFPTVSTLIPASCLTSQLGRPYSVQKWWKVVFCGFWWAFAAAKWGKVFLGSYAINLDAKGRLAIPAKVRDELAAVCGGKVVVTAHTEERCLLVYPEQQWQDLQPRIEALPNINRKARLMQRLLLGYATPLEMDSNGRVLLPATLREYAGLDKKLMLVGQGKKLELWSEESWQSWINEAGGDELPEEVLALVL